MAHWPRSDILALLGILATLLVAVTKPARDLVARLVDGLWFRLGFPRRRYRRMFSEKYRLLDNVYLDKRERLDLGGTYVTLSAVGGSADPQHQTVATAVLADRENQRLIITGAPGSGKSTLLKAYAVGTTGSLKRTEGSADLLRIRPSREISFFVQLRRMTGAIGIWDHLINEILISDYGFKKSKAEKFLRRLLRKNRCLILLDGLDEVPDDRYQAVHTAILAFAEDHDPERPTASARIVLTCRTQNFRLAEWTTFSEVEHGLSPMQDAQILGYLTNRRKDFAAKGMTPERFFTAIEGSATFDLHRTPLVLAMSVALYLERHIEAVPNSISALYEAMIRTMLDRHRFIPDGPPVNAFSRDDKERFLQQFALTMAERAQAFQDFTAEELRAEAVRVAPSLSRVRVEQAQAFVDEIVNRSGLLSPIAPGYYTFAHRSIQEYLIGAQLRDREANGAHLLLSRAGDGEWQQVILFFAAGRTAVVENFIEKLCEQDCELAIRCLANAETQNINELAVRMLREFTAKTLEPSVFTGVVQSRLAAVLYACRAVPEPVRVTAISCAEQLLQQITAEHFTLVGGDDNLLRVLKELVATNADAVASVVPDLAESIPDDPRLVPVLWRCLNVLDPATAREACEKLIGRLLVMAMDPACFVGLEAQPALGGAAFDDQLRRRAYPFDDALPMGSNLVTLLARAEELHVTPPRTNTFLDARDADPRFFANLERDNRRTIRFSLYWPGFIMSLLASVAAVGRAVWIAAAHPHSLLEPYGWRNILVFTMPMILSFMIVKSLNAGFVPGILHQLTAQESLHFLDIVPDSLSIGLFLIISASFSISFTELLQNSIVWFIVIATLANIMGIYLSTTGIFSRAKVYTLNKRNPYVDAYTDPASAHWLREPASGS